MAILNAGDPPLKLLSVQGGFVVDLPHFTGSERCWVQIRFANTGNLQIELIDTSAVTGSLFGTGKTQTSGDFDIVSFITTEGVGNCRFSIVPADLNNPQSSPVYALLLIRQ